MKIFYQILLIIIISILQITLVPHFIIYGSIFNLIFIVILSLIFLSRFGLALWWVGLGGALLDLASPYFFGLNILALIIIYLIVGYLVYKVFHQPNILIAFAFFFIAAVVFDAILSLLLKNPISYIIFANGFYNAIVGTIIFYFLNKNMPKEEKIKIFS